MEKAADRIQTNLATIIIVLLDIEKQDIKEDTACYVQKTES
jgi:hypothetical protein